ncbi:hypothetical protein BLNAU_17285 [Blattamonas nauphoetae]|uniref:Uncharacterized protein n=1 Tax=Blattamonas nauphoetae TaxID=2049346 RepID=A0ABQ9X7F9_9EUKA|nr:hypothetical protein BLNAU_17285 [Blattamonas nauphoetae]
MTLKKFSAYDVLLKLMPSPNGSCSNFAESLVLLLTSSNEELVQSTLSLLNEVVHQLFSSSSFDLIETGFFSLLPHSFYVQDLHLSPHLELPLTDIVGTFLCYLQPLIKSGICSQWQFSSESFNDTFINKFFNHVEPFLEFISSNRRRITDSEDSRPFPQILANLVEYSPNLEQMTLFVLSSSLSVSCTDCPVFFENDNLTADLVRNVVKGISEWRTEGPAVLKRGRLIQSKLRDEGFSDEVELFLKCTRWNLSESVVVLSITHSNDIRRTAGKERTGGCFGKEWGAKNDTDFETLEK